IAHHVCHLLDFFRARGLVTGTTLAHDVGPDRAMRHVGADVDGSLHSRKGVEVLAEGFPFEADSGGERFARNILDRVHQADEVAFFAWPNGCEADTAIAHYHGGDPIPARGGEERIPCDLAVVMRMNIDPSRRGYQAARVDLSRAGARFAFHA